VETPTIPVPALIGGGALAALLWSRRRDHAALASTATSVHTLPGQWVWPVPIWQGRRPVRSDGFGSPRPGGASHEGVDIMFARTPMDTLRPGTPNGSASHVMPDDMVALAAADGSVWSAGWTPRGFSVVIDHAPLAPVATYYTHLASLLVSPTTRGMSSQRVHAGQPLGTIGFDPLDLARLKHLHFALWRGGPAGAIDPAPAMQRWQFVDDPRAVARNGGLVYRPVGNPGEDYPEWVRNLRGKSGVYVIRQDDEVVYVGESHTNRLHETLTRHLQGWRRWKSYWRGQYGEGHDPGLTYPRGDVEVAVRITPPSRALDEEARLILRLRPRDNLRGQPADMEPAPF
jgi:hypothetical protein